METELKRDEDCQERGVFGTGKQKLRAKANKARASLLDERKLASLLWDS